MGFGVLYLVFYILIRRSGDCSFLSPSPADKLDGERRSRLDWLFRCSCQEHEFLDSRLNQEVRGWKHLCFRQTFLFLPKFVYRLRMCSNHT